MHAYLLISEILKAIFVEVTQVARVGVRPSCTTLYYLALTCRASRELAQDALWAHIQSSEVLAMCLPQDARSQPVKMSLKNAAKFGYTPSTMAAACRARLLRPLVDDDWATFQKYARRVRSLTFETYNMSRPGLHESAALALLDSHALLSPLFPRLQELTWYDEREIFVPCLQRCISAILARLVIDSEHWPPVMVDLVAGLGKACPKIKEFRCSTPPASLCAMLSDLVTCWGDLEILTTGAVSCISNTAERAGDTCDIWSQPGTGFGVQRHIFVGQVPHNCSKERFASRFLAPLQISAKNVQLETKTPLNAVYLDHLLFSLTGHFKPGVLEWLDVLASRPNRAEFINHAPFPFTASAFRMLRAFAELTRLNLGSMHISITDDEAPRPRFRMAVNGISLPWHEMGGEFPAWA